MNPKTDPLRGGFDAAHLYPHTAHLFIYLLHTVTAQCNCKPQLHTVLLPSWLHSIVLLSKLSHQAKPFSQTVATNTTSILGFFICIYRTHKLYRFVSNLCPCLEGGQVNPELDRFEFLLRLLTLSYKNAMQVQSNIYIHTLHYITLHCIALHYITLHYITIQYNTIHTYIHTYIYIH